MHPSRMVVLAGPGPQRQDQATPLPLVNVAGISVIERVIARVARAGFRDIAVVVDHRADEIRRHVLDLSRRRGIPLTVVRDDWSWEGNGKFVSALRGIVDDTPYVLLAADRVPSHALLEFLRAQPMRFGEIAVAVDGNLRIESPHEGTARALPTCDEHWSLPVRTSEDRRAATEQLVRSSAKPFDGTLASRINRPLSDLTTRAFVSQLPSATSVQVTLLAFAVSATAAAAFALGLPLVAGILVQVAAVLDRSDGQIARVTEQPSAFGSFLDSVLDRASDGLVITGGGIYLATDVHLGSIFGPAQVPLAIAVNGAALLSHLLVSYTTSKATIEVGHWYQGSLIGGGRGRDRRLLIISAGGGLAAIEPAALAVALVLVALLSTGIVVSRLVWSSWLCGRGSTVTGVRAVVLDFDGTIADSMKFLTDLGVDLIVDELSFTRPEAADAYLATTGTDFRSQLAELAPGHPTAMQLAERFETAKATWVPRCKVFADVLPAIDRLKSAGVPVFVCSSTRFQLVHDFCEQHDLQRRLTSVDGWRPGHDKSMQLARAVDVTGFRRGEVVFVGDSRRDADIARSIGTQFVGVVRDGSRDAFEGTGEHVVSSLSQLASDLSRAVRGPITTELPMPIAPPHRRSSLGAAPNRGEWLSAIRRSERCRRP